MIHTNVVHVLLQFYDPVLWVRGLAPTAGMKNAMHGAGLPHMHLTAERMLVEPLKAHGAW